MCTENKLSVCSAVYCNNFYVHVCLDYKVFLYPTQVAIKIIDKTQLNPGSLQKVCL